VIRRILHIFIKKIVNTHLLVKYESMIFLYSCFSDSCSPGLSVRSQISCLGTFLSTGTLRYHSKIFFFFFKLNFFKMCFIILSLLTLLPLEPVSCHIVVTFLSVIFEDFFVFIFAFLSVICEVIICILACLTRVALIKVALDRSRILCLGTTAHSCFVLQ
jgi:hypothetical protein